MSQTFKYLVYDIESIINKPLLNRVLFSGKGLSDEDAYQEHLKELATEGRDFVNPAYHRPVSLAAIAVGEDYTISRIGLLGEEPKTAASITREFWKVYNQNKPILVDFNGHGYDVRLMELWAFQLGVQIHGRHFAKFGTRYRFADEQHLDLHDFLTNNGAIRYRGGLDLFAKLLGKPGKMETKGDMVQELHDKGEQFKIDDYCLGDAMDTYFVFLRTRVIKGDISLNEEKERVLQAKEMMIQKQKDEGYFKLYLENFQDWVPDEN